MITQFFAAFFSGATKKRIRLAIFIFKWFLIGKYHCNLPNWAIRFWWVVHKLLWFFMAFSSAIVAREILIRLAS